VIDSLIQKQDTFQIIRDQIAAILATEIANQYALAQVEGSVDAELWNFKVFVETTNPVEAWLEEDPYDRIDLTPIVNVWYDTTTFSGASSIQAGRQTGNGTFQIDCYAAGVAQDTATGHLPGDVDAANRAQNVLMLVRNILMSSEYVYLALARNLVGNRNIQSTTMLQPQFASASARKIVCARVSFGVNYNEFAPENTFPDLELISVDVSENGRVVIQAEYDKT
jgi:hypothetical protein